MKLLQGFLILFLLGLPVLVHANDPEVQADFLLAKISAALKKDRTSAALAYCTTLEKLGPSLKEPLPESFYFDYIEALHRSGLKENTLSRAYAYLNKYGKNSPHYPQVSAIVKELQLDAIRAGIKDPDAAVIVWEEMNRIEKEKEHVQTLDVLRSCQSEAIALEGGEKELNLEFETINARSVALLAAKAALDKRKALIDGSIPGTPTEQKQLRLDFNRDSQAYNDAVNDFNSARETYDAKVEGQSSRLRHFEDHCANLYVVKADMEVVCGKSDDWFCRGIE